MRSGRTDGRTGRWERKGGNNLNKYFSNYIRLGFFVEKKKCYVNTKIELFLLVVFRGELAGSGGGGRLEALANLVLLLLALRLRAVLVGVGVVARLAALRTLVQSQDGADHLAERVLERVGHEDRLVLAVVLAEAASHGQVGCGRRRRSSR